MEGLGVCRTRWQDMLAEAPFMDRLIVNVCVWFRKEGDEAFLNSKLGSGIASVRGSAGTPQVELNAPLVQLADTGHNARHRNAFDPHRTNLRVIDINKHHALVHWFSVPSHPRCAAFMPCASSHEEAMQYHTNAASALNNCLADSFSAEKNEYPPGSFQSSYRTSGGCDMRRLTFDMSGMTRQAKPAVACPLDGGVSPGERRHEPWCATTLT